MIRQIRGNLNGSETFYWTYWHVGSGRFFRCDFVAGEISARKI